jgi:chromosome partitioning protein
VKKTALIAQKNGVGKTTIAVNLAVAAGLKTALFDLDQQESAVIWADRRKSESPHVSNSLQSGDCLKRSKRRNRGSSIW